MVFSCFCPLQRVRSERNYPISVSVERATPIAHSLSFWFFHHNNVPTRFQLNSSITVLLCHNSQCHIETILHTHICSAIANNMNQECIFLGNMTAYHLKWKMDALCRKSIWGQKLSATLKVIHCRSGTDHGIFQPSTYEKSYNEFSMINYLWPIEQLEN